MANTPRRPLRVVVNAGPTREPMDDVRFLTNASTGRMGRALAVAARRRGARVTLVLGPCELGPPRGVRTVRVTTARDLLRETARAARGADLVVFAAAPADWRPAAPVRGKIKKDGRGRDVTLRLVENPDVAATLGRRKGRRVHVGFALEVVRPFEHALDKLARKRFDAVVVNGPENVGRGGGRAWFVARGADPVPLPTGDKAATARAILARTWPLLLARAPGGPRPRARRPRR